MTEFHFIRPLWLLAMLVLIVAIYLLKKLRVSHSGWDQILPKHLAQILITPNTQQNDKQPKSKPLSLIPVSLIGLLTIIALAGPTWQKQPQPVFQINQGSVLIMDMSYSMYATDIIPNRLTRARYKSIDLLNNLTEGDVGLIAYAGDAFIISPLTEDTNNIKLLLPSLTPDIMPELGSNPLAALLMADDMLKNSGHVKGDIYWLTDGVDQGDVDDINQFSKTHPHNLHILGIGTKSGAPIKLTNGELLKDNSGAIIIPHLNPERLAGIATQGHGNYQSISNDNHDIESLLANNLFNQPQKMQDKSKQEKRSEQLGDQWQEAGPYLLLIILPLLLSYFRRGNIVMIFPLALLLYPNQQAQANVWQDLWKTSDQQAQQKFEKKAYKAAAEQFKQPLWQGSAYYKAGEYQQALTAFKKSDSAQALYNQGNALAKLQKLDQAIEAYKKALAKDPSLKDAKKNKKLLEALKKQQEQQNKKDKKSKDNKSEKDNEQQNQDKKGEQQQNSGQQKSDSKKNNQKQKQDQSNKDQQKNNTDNSNKSDKEQEQTKQKQKKEKENNKKAQKKKVEQAAKKEAEKNLTPEQKAARTKAQLAKEQHDKEMKQKYQQLMNKVTDDPYLLLRNKMQLEYQKRRGNTSNKGIDKKW